MPLIGSKGLSTCAIAPIAQPGIAAMYSTSSLSAGGVCIVYTKRVNR